MNQFSINAIKQLPRILLVIFLGCQLSSGMCEEVLHIGALTDKRPSTIMTQMILTEAYSQLNVAIKFESMPNNRVLDSLIEKTIDGIDFRLANTPITDLIKIDIPITFDDMVVYSTDPTIVIKNYAGLKPYKIGYLAGATLFRLRLEGMQTETAADLSSLFRKLSAGRTDLVIDSRSTYCYATKLGLTNIIMLEPSLEKVQGYHWISKRFEYLKPRLESVLKKMQSDGSMQKIQNQVMQDYAQSCR